MYDHLNIYENVETQEEGVKWNVIMKNYKKIRRKLVRLK